MNINAVRLVLVAAIIGSVVMFKDSWYSYVFLNAYALILLSLSATHYHSSDIAKYISTVRWPLTVVAPNGDLYIVS